MFFVYVIHGLDSHLESHFSNWLLYHIKWRRQNHTDAMPEEPVVNQVKIVQNATVAINVN